MLYQNDYQRVNKDHLTPRSQDQIEIVCLDLFESDHGDEGRDVIVIDKQLAAEIRTLRNKIKKAVRAVDQELITGPVDIEKNHTSEFFSLRDVSQQCAALCADLENMQADYWKWKVLLIEDCKTLDELRQPPLSQQRADLFLAIIVSLKGAMQYRHRTAGEFVKYSFHKAVATLSPERQTLMKEVNGEINRLADKLDKYFQLVKYPHNPIVMKREIKSDLKTAFESIMEKLAAFREKFFAEFGKASKSMSEVREEEEEMYQRVSEEIERIYQTIEQKLSHSCPTLLGTYKPKTFKASK